MLIAMTVRNAMEEFHAENLSDAQMAELDPLVRNAIATAVHALDNMHLHTGARNYIRFQHMLVPEYWEPPVLLDDYVRSWELADDEPIACRHCGRRLVDLGEGRSVRWKHLGAAGGLNTGCRAASFVPGKGWDESISPGSKAAPRV